MTHATMPHALDNELCVGIATCSEECQSWGGDGYRPSCNTRNVHGTTVTAVPARAPMQHLLWRYHRPADCQDPNACENTADVERLECGTVAPSNGCPAPATARSAIGDCCDDFVDADQTGGGGGECAGTDVSSDGWCDASTNNSGSWMEATVVSPPVLMELTSVEPGQATIASTLPLRNTGGCNCR